jgi:hypothetical protein
MFLRCHERKKDGKLHHYWSIVESRRVAGGPPVQRQVLYLGEISDSQEAAWRKSIEVFDEEKETPEQFCLFSSDKVIADDQVNALSLVLSEMRLLRPRSFGDCWLGCLLWDELGLGAFWDGKLASDRAGVPWSKVLQVATHGYSRDGRPDCRQVVIALVVTSEGLPLAYEVLAGNRLDKTTLTEFLEKIQSMCGKARRVWVMDRGIPTRATLSQMRRDEVAYLVGTPKALLRELEKEMLDKPWERVHGGMKVKLLEKDGEFYVRAHSQQRQMKETAMRRRKLKKLLRGLNRLKRRPPKRDRLLKRVCIAPVGTGERYHRS